MGKVKPENEWKFKCANTGKALQRRKRYYRNGKYYLNKTSFQAQMKKEAEARAKEAEEKAQEAEAQAAKEAEEKAKEAEAQVQEAEVKPAETTEA